VNRAAKALIARDPLISANAVRFLLMAGTSASTFLAGFRQRQNEEILSMGQLPTRSLVERQARVHNGIGIFFTYASRERIKLSYWTDRYHYIEDTKYFGPNGYTIATELSIFRQCIPDTLITALPGRALREVIGYDNNPAFFASRYSTIVAAEVRDWPDGDSLVLTLPIKWYPLSRVLPHLR